MIATDIAPPPRPARSPNADMADAATPLIRNCWYVAAWSSEVGRTLLSRRLLGNQVLLYRTADGAAVALHDRCPHRSLPLSNGCLEGDAVRCGYHGLLFDQEGRCVDAPSVGRAPRALTVPAYHVVERGPLVWIWLGDDAPDAADIPDTWWLDHPDWAYGSGQMTIESNYVALHENLLDLSHFTFLHPGNIGTPEYAAAPYQVSSSADGVHVERHVADCEVPGVYRATGLGDARISRLATSDFVSPGLHSASALLTDLAPAADARVRFTVRVTHFVTPRDLDGTHYFFAIARDFSLDDPSATEAMRASALQAFREDAAALEAISVMQKAEPGFVEMSLRSDEAGVKMRRMLQARADGERRTG